MRLVVTIIAVLLISAPVLWAAETKDAPQRYSLNLWAKDLLSVIERGPEFLSREDQYQVAAFPENDSKVTLEEIEYLHSLVPQRTAETIAEIKYENSGALVRHVFSKAGLFERAGNKDAKEVMEIVDKDLSYFVLASKKDFARPRPSHLDPTLTTVINNPDHASYPSGHAAQAHMVALMLSGFDPEHEDEYKKLAYAIAHRREIAGVHFPSDTKAGMEMAEHFYKKFRSIPAFEKKYQNAKLTYIKPNLQKEED